MTDGKILELKNISYSYSGEKNVLNSVSVGIKKKERIAVLGTNGSGKSTLFLCCNGVLHPNSGDIFLHGKKVERKKNQMINLRKAVGIVFQDPNQQFIGTTVFDDISFGLLNMGLDADTVRKKTDNIIKDMGLDKLRDRPPQYLSGGEKKRLSIADVVVMEPEIILFDEPTAFLDGYNIELFKEILDKLYSQDKTLVISTHDIDFALDWADRVIILKDGEIISDGYAVDILTDKLILDTAALKPPFLYSIMNVLNSQGIINDIPHHPRNISELEFILRK